MTTFSPTLSGTMRVLLAARVASVRNAFHLALRTGRLRLATGVAVALFFWIGLFGLFYGGFRFISQAQFAPFKPLVLGYLFGLFFVTLMVLLVISNAVIAYLGLFRSRETQFLMSQPLPAANVFAYKFTESLVFSSWAFLLLVTPLMVAYGVTSEVPWYYYPAFFLYFPPFVVIPATVGTLLSLLVAAWVPRTRVGWLSAGAGVAAIVGLGALVARWWPAWTTPAATEWLQWFFLRLRFTQGPLLPSSWITRGVLAAAEGRLGTMVFYLLLLLSNGLFVGMVAYLVAGRVYPRAWNRTQGGTSRRRRASGRALDGIVNRLFFFTSRPARLLIAKDLRTFRRDPAQWSQFLIFFGVLAAYIGNLRTLAYDLKAEEFKAMVSLLNLSVVAMVVATFACRFVFPLMSLEGRNFWLLGLAPIRRRSVLLGKYVFAAAGSVLISVALVVTSDVLLRSPPRVVLLDVLAMVLMSNGIAGISVGLGARLPSLDEDNPSKIAAGFGGTLDLIVALFYIAIMVALMAVPAHLQFAGRLPGSHLAVAAGPIFVLLAVFVTAVAVAVPMSLGIRHFRRMEF